VRYVHQLFGEQAWRHPGWAAVASGRTQLTYRQLNQSANKLAHHLAGMGVGPETLVGVCLERGVETVRCLLAILKAGGAYLPLDPSLPAARLRQMCAEARPLVILASHADARTFAETDARLLLIDERGLRLADRPATAPEVSLEPENLAYVIYTSGSTGQPKAVAVSHGSLACVSQEISREYQISPDDRVLQLASLGFDTSVEQIMVALTCGARLMLPPAGTIAPTDLLRYLAAEQVTVIDLTPAYWHQLLVLTEPGDERLRSVRLMITGGDRASPADCAAAMRAAPGARLLNAYGLTETTITSTLQETDEKLLTASAAVPVGKPIRHAQVLVLDQNLNEVPAGTAGEIYIGGCGVARGYLGRPELTAELFLPNARGVPAGSRMYRTGDLGRWRDDGNLELIGRVDHQLKIRGFRVEPAEVESALAGHPEIAEAAVIAHEFGPGNRQLAAYYTRRHPRDPADPADPADPGGPADGKTQDLLSVASLRSFLAPRVPSFMVPAVFIALEAMPLTPQGKIDRRALPRPVTVASGGLDRGYTPIQAGMSHLWSRMLTTGRVGLDDDFFALGGNSLLAAEMLAHARVMFGIGPSHVRPLTRRLLRDPTLRGFSKATQDARTGRLTARGADARVDFSAEARLTDPIHLDAGPPPDWKQPREILLTGATGFLGLYLLRELLTATTARVHCLVRADSAADARRRIEQAAERYGIDGLTTDRIVPLAGDLAEPDLGLAPETFSELARTIDSIHHAGATVNFVYPYQDLRAANVTGTRELIRLAGLYRGIPIHYISTTTVLAGFGAMGVHEVTEDTPLAYADHLCMGYIETKFVAEELLRNASRAGLPVAIYRPLDIVGDQHTGAWNTATEMCALIRFITDKGVAPDIDLPLDFVPVDVCAAAIGYISSHVEAVGSTYHLASPKYALLGSLVDRLRTHGYAIKTIPYHEWVDELLKNAAEDPGHPMTPFVPLFVDHCEEPGLTVAEMYFEHIFPAYTRSHAEAALRGSGVVFPPVDEKLLDLNIGRLITTGYLKSPL
jgi:amino acid adenylation domain-containing protein/thioester reductase-like protein